MKPLRSYINIRKKSSTIKATDKTIKKIIKDELDRLGHDTNLNHIDVSEVTSMRNLFNCEYNILLGYRYEDMNPDISQWDVSNVRNMGGMFYKCKVFNCNISEWNVHKVKNMCDMFYECKIFNQELIQWDVSNAINMECMFYGCTKFNQNLSTWDVSKVESHDYMFRDCYIREEFKPKFK